jgi:hypothetical protein
MALTLLSPLNNIYRRDVSINTGTLSVDPTNANCVIAGQWVTLDTNGLATDPTSATALSYQVFSEKGDYSAQALGKVTILNSFDYIAETDHIVATSIVAGSQLMVDGDGKLLLATTGSNNFVVAIALAAPSNGVLKYQRISPFLLA